ncbi:type II secretion system minor pseudopilin GspK [Scleromatobacter humisilvae]|uniref:Type II secretion system protein K n=1 Tax=Scleromatobacter humisilvae TaxID=2897159 RepID=A0A9X2C163_9BURK|nr:type II secretion system minor pseudopilin GspK [Scleromatobacter humisilvae]MCK9685444.1 type II secretion system minor pseudopilin GspK [Scleromatobacter humisilvae]
MGHMRTRGRQSGAALLLALLIMTLVATLAAGMVWLQWRGIEVEAAERARTQAEWLLNASLDWGNLILKSSIRNSYTDDDLGQPWATPLAETKLSSFLSADGNHQDDSGPEAYLSGQITDAQSKYNLFNLVNSDAAGKNTEIQRLQILFSAIGVSPDVAATIAAGLRASYSAQQLQKDQSGQADATNAVVMPIEVADLAWYGVDPKVVKTIEPFVQILPFTGTAPVPINANTAPAEVLMAGCPGMTRAQAEQVILQRRQKPFDDPAKVTANIGMPVATACGGGADNPGPKVLYSVKSQYFEIFGQLRYEQHVIRERSVVYRKDQFSVQVLRRERVPPDPVAAAAPA